MEASEAFEMFVKHFPPAENLQAANGFKSYGEIHDLVEQWASEPLKALFVQECLESNGYVTEVIGDRVMYLIG